MTNSRDGLVGSTVGSSFDRSPRDSTVPGASAIAATVNGGRIGDDELAAARIEAARLAAELARLKGSIDQHNAGLAERENALQASFDSLRQSYNSILSMNSFRIMMRALEAYGRLRGIRIALPPAPERVRVRLGRLVPSVGDPAIPYEAGAALGARRGSDDAEVTVQPMAKRTEPCILVQVGSLDRGGVEQVVYDQARGLEALGKRVVVVVTGAGGEIASRLSRNGGEVEILGGFSLDSYAEIIDGLQIEAAITHYSYEGLPLLERRRIPIVEVVHNYYHWCQHDIAGFRARSAPVTHRVAVSTGVADFHADVFGYPRKEIRVIPNPINREGLVRPERQFLDAARRRDKGVFTFINVAQFFAAKAQSMLVSAFAEIHREFPQARLTLLGSFSDPKVHAAIVAQIEALGIDGMVQMPGFVDRRQLSRYLSVSHVFVQPSVYEGYSVAMTEAAHFALPMILTSIGGAIDVVENNDCGILVPPHAETLKGLKETAVFDLGMRRQPPNLPQLVDAMRSMIVDYDAWSERGYIGQARIDRHTVEQFCRSYLDVIGRRVATAA
jgi:glycosyltransferase involved in cell wall biosynthesis